MQHIREVEAMRSFDENTRVKLPATIQFMRLGYVYQSLKTEDIDIDFNTKIFVNRFKPALEKINGRKFTYDEIKDILIEINRSIKNNDLGKEFYYWLINPIDKVKLIDFDTVENNDFAIVDELPFSVRENTNEGSFRPDITILINGIPLGFLEVKKPNNEGGIQAEFNRMINERLKEGAFKKFFNMLQIVSFSNNMEYEEETDAAEDVKAGSFYTTPNGQHTSFSFFREDSPVYHKNYAYQDISQETIEDIVKDCGYRKKDAATAEFQTDLSPYTPCNRFITSLFDKERILYFLQYGMMFRSGKIPQKYIMRYPQFFATRKIIERLRAGGKGGIIWHTQGSGKTALAAYANRIIQEYYAKQDIVTRFFFVVDRLDLLTQASSEFTACGLTVVNCHNKAEFAKELNKPLSTSANISMIGEVCVVNIHKFSDSMPESRNEYNVRVQRIFFVDEAHRSYRKNGEYFKNLMICDPNAIYIALTGTPLLSKKERSNLKFGDYIHKYFYDKSIADGYTLRIKKEDIDTVARSEIKQNLDIEGDIDYNSKEIYESDAYVKALGLFIEKDFLNFRFQNHDKTIGGMIVCRTNCQARKVHQWFKEHSKLNTGLVITEESDPTQREINKNNQINFRETTQPDMLVVNFMLTTGYDVKRLKKMYLLRAPHAQTLLQTISRVNRPYKSDNGKIYKYGYIVDFVDIEQEYDQTISAYIKELERDFNDADDGEYSLSGLVVDKEEIYEKYQTYAAQLEDIIPTANLSQFAKIMEHYNKDTLLKIRRLLNQIKDCQIEFILSHADDYAKEIDSEHIKKLLHTVQDRINFINLSEHSVDALDVLSDEEVVQILYEFIKTHISIMDMGNISPDNPEFKHFTDVVQAVQDEIKKNKNKDDIAIIKLDELLQQIFQNLHIHDLNDLSSLTDELLTALQQARAINDENERLSAAYDGNYAFVKTYQDIASKYPSIDTTDIEQLLVIIYEEMKVYLTKENTILLGRKRFVKMIKPQVTISLVKRRLFPKIKDCYDKTLEELYSNIQLF